MTPLVVNTPEPMLKMKILVVKDDREKTLKALHKIGALHIDTGRELDPVDRGVIEKEKTRISSLFGKVTELLSYTNHTKEVIPTESIDVIYTRPAEELGEEVDGLYVSLHNLYQKTLSPSTELAQLEELKTYLEPLSHHTTLNVNDINYTGSYLFSRTILLSAETYWNYESRIREFFIEFVTDIVGNRVVVFGIGKIENLPHLNALISGIEGRVLQASEEDASLRDFLKTTTEKIAYLRKELTVIRDALRKKTEENLERLILLREVILAEMDRLSALEKAAEAKYVTMITGWIPESVAETVISELKDSVTNIYLDITEPGPGEEPPSKLRNRGGFRPFEIIINLFGTPKYREWDPTPIITYSFALFFGLMVCDVIYAIGVALLGKFLLAKFVDDPHTENFKMFQRLLYICSGVALVGGLLTGQYLGNIHTLFGFEDLALSQAVKEGLQDPVSFVVIALGIGFIHVNIAHILAMAKNIKERKHWRVINKVGLFILQLGLPGVLNSMLGVDIPGFTPVIYSIFNYVMYAGILLIIISSIAISGGLGAIMWLFDITGLLGDIMSYARLAGVGLATFYLASTFNMLSEMFREMIPGVIGAIIGTIIGVLIIVFGHIFNVVMTAITGFIHSLRLCFVEFLFKFYEGGGDQYSPFKIKKKPTLSVTVKS